MCKRSPFRQIEFDMQQFDEFTLCGSCQSLVNFAFREANINSNLISVGVHSTNSQSGRAQLFYCCMFLFLVINSVCCNSGPSNLIV